MNLNTMSEVYAAQTQQALGFQLKSRTTGRLWKAIYKAPNGSFLITDINGTKDALVSGSEDRYEFADPRFDAAATRRHELNAKLAELMNKEAQQEQAIELLREEITEVENELDTLTDNF